MFHMCIHFGFRRVSFSLSWATSCTEKLNLGMAHCQHLLSVKLSLSDITLTAGCLKQDRWNPETGTQRIIPCSFEGFHSGLSLPLLYSGFREAH